MKALVFLTTRIPVELKAKIEKLAKDERRSVSQIVRMILEKSTQIERKP